MSNTYKLSASLQRPVVLATGGTGGHVMPAIALASCLTEKGYKAQFMIDQRAQNYMLTLEACSVLPLESTHFKSFKFWKNFFHSFKQARYYLKITSPLCVIAFGGYCCLPPALAAISLGIPLYLHEQNAVLGKAHKILLPWAKKLFLSFSPTQRIPSLFQKKGVFTGLPVRSSFYKTSPSQDAKLSHKDASFRILVLGGSQGAAFFSQLVPQALCLLPDTLQKSIEIHHQCPQATLADTTQAYNVFQGKVTLQPFFQDLAHEMQQAHFIISRAGASTLAELRVMGKQALFIPLPKAIHDHQTYNAQSQCAQGGGWMIKQADITPRVLADLIKMRYSERHTETGDFVTLKNRPEEMMIHFMDLL